MSNEEELEDLRDRIKLLEEQGRDLEEEAENARFQVSCREEDLKRMEAALRNALDLVSYLSGRLF